MQNLFDKNQYVLLRQRLERLKPNAQRMWGKMEIAQMLAHCNAQIESATGKTIRPDESTFFARNVIRRVLPFITKIPLGQKTGAGLAISDARNFDIEKKRLLDNLEQAHLNGINGNWYPHLKFGKLSAKEWGHLICIHIDHHLRQFSN